MFKIGDIVVRNNKIGVADTHTSKQGWIGLITGQGTKPDTYRVYWYAIKDDTNCTHERCLELLTKNKETTMTTLSNMMKKLLDKPTQTLVKAGYINGDLDLTCEGINALDSLVFTDYKEKLVAMAEAKIAEEEAK